MLNRITSFQKITLPGHCGSTIAEEMTYKAGMKSHLIVILTTMSALIILESLNIIPQEEEQL